MGSTQDAPSEAALAVIGTDAGGLGGLPAPSLALVRAADRILQHLDEGGLKVHPESLRQHAALTAPNRASSWPVWAALLESSDDGIARLLTGP